MSDEYYRCKVCGNEYMEETEDEHMKCDECGGIDTQCIYAQWNKEDGKD